MKRSSLRSGAVLGAMALATSTLLIPQLIPSAAHAAPTPDLGGPAELLRYIGDASSATGNALSNGQCDVNGDGYDDAVVGAWFWDKAPVNNIGAAYVIFGSEDANGVPLADPEEANAARIDGPTNGPNGETRTSGDFVAFAVACLGDVDNDGNDDIAISNYDQQRAYVVFGAKNFTGLSLDALGDRGFLVKGQQGGDSRVSYSMSSAGDLNDDGFGDFAIAELAADNNGRNNSGRIWVIAGQAGIEDVDLVNPAPGQVLLTVDGAAAEERLSVSAAAGDVNGDGIDDFLLGSYVATPWGTAVAATGAAYVVYGREGAATRAIDAASLGADGFTIRGPQRQRDRLGISVSPAGDVNGDGKADLLIGADGVNNASTGPRSGGAAVVFGSDSGATVYTDPLAANGQAVFTCPEAETPGTCVTPSRRGYWINGINNSDSTGYSVAGLGDVTGDGVPDFALGAWGHDPVNPDAAPATMSNAGAVFIVRGKADTVVQNLADLTDTTGYRIDGLRAGDRFGRQVGKIGDFDGNGSTDFYAGGDFSQRPLSAPQAQAGEVTVGLLGKLNIAVAVTGPATVLPGADATFAATVVKPAGVRTPVATGTVDFALAGTSIQGCAAVPVVDGAASCTTASATEVSGAVTATYSGTDVLKQATSDAIAFAVTRRATTLRPATAGRFTYGTRPAALTGTVTGAGAALTGTVRISSGSTILGTATVAGGRYAVRPTATALRPGTHNLTVAYSGDPEHAAATSTQKVTVARARATVNVTTKRTIKVGARSVVRVRVSATGVVPTGRVAVVVNGKVVRTVKLAAGRARVVLPKAPKVGVRKVRVRYLGATTVAPRVSTVATVRVVRR